MRRIVFLSGLVAGLLAIILFAAGPATAQKPSWDDDGKKGKGSKKADSPEPQRMQSEDRRQETGHQQEYQRSGSQHQDRHGDGGQGFFAGRDRSYIDRYYADQYRSGKCPPGLAKKGNGCMPPGQAKKWGMNRPLPRDVVFYDLPQDVLVHLGPPPTGHRFVRVAQDILLIAVGTGMVVDAIEDLGRIY